MHRLKAASTVVALASALAACDAKTAPLFEPQGTGTLEGFIFFDADRNGIFDPSAGDSALRNVRIRSLLPRFRPCPTHRSRRASRCDSGDSE